MELTVILALLCAGLAMGWINNLAGAAGVLGLFALEACAGLDTQTANGSLRVAALGVGLLGVIGFRSRGQRVPLRLWALSLLTIPGTVLGVWLAVELPVWVYRTVLASALVLVLWQQLRNRRLPLDTVAKVQPRWLYPLLFTCIGLYMGFVQIGFGLVVILLLTGVYSRDLVEVNAAKMALAFTTAITATASFAVADAIAWPPAITLAIGCGIGSFLAGRWSVRRGHGAVRTLVLVICVAALGRLSWQALAT